MTLKPLYISICDVCKKDKPIVLVCLVGAGLCGACQEDQQRISFDAIPSIAFDAIVPLASEEY